MAKQLNVPEGARVVERMPFGMLATGFFVKGKEVFYAMQHGRWTFHFPVLEDGTVSRHGGGPAIYPGEAVDIIDPASIGISQLVFKD
jgi:hypothetical protein